MSAISVAKDDNEGRQRFSLGQQLAHWINDAKKASFRCARDDIGPQNAEANNVESQANIRASQLILPNYMVGPWMEGRKIRLNVTKEMHDDFRSGITASAIKLAKRVPF